MKFRIRPETSADHAAVFDLTERAFRDMDISDHSEHLLVERLRKSSAFVPELSLVAETAGKIVGHILFTEVQIVQEGQEWTALALAPVSVLPEFQRRGVGSELIRAAHERAREMGYTSVVLIGHEHYYPRFGYQRADQYGIRFPFEVPPENAMVLELVRGGLNGVSGDVVYPKAFFR